LRARRVCNNVRVGVGLIVIEPVLHKNAPLKFALALRKKSESSERDEATRLTAAEVVHGK
jgi:hypothetical protein